jgi:hypothetical protein
MKDRQTDRPLRTKRLTDRQTDRRTDPEDKGMDRQIDRWADGWMGRQTDRQVRLCFDLQERFIDKLCMAWVRSTHKDRQRDEATIFCN